MSHKCGPSCNRKQGERVYCSACAKWRGGTGSHIRFGDTTSVPLIRRVGEDTAPPQRLPR